jgi:hypothetical protein
VVTFVIVRRFQGGFGGTVERERKEGNVLLSIRYGIPNTSNIVTPAIRIIGFFSRLSGETIFITSS